jgi:hypothetical protein
VRALALAAGVPLELVQRVTGHRTVEVVMKHYFRPGREDFRQVILKAMPTALAKQPSLPLRSATRSNVEIRVAMARLGFETRVRRR